ncbi:DUF7940 domain-containing protein [Serratia sp. IR-2025]
MKLVENWKSAWKWYSVHIMVVIVALPEIWGYFPQEFKESLPPHALTGLTTFLGISAIVARLVSQEKRDDQRSN